MRETPASTLLLLRKTEQEFGHETFR